VGDVNFDHVGQVLRQAGNFDVRQVQVDFAALSLDADGAFLIDQVHRYGGGQLLASNHALEVSVQDEVLRRVALQGLDHDVLAGAVDVQGDHVAERDFVFQHFGQVFGQQADGQRLLVATVDNGRNHVFVTTQAAARTFPQVGTRSGFQGKFSHFSFSKLALPTIRLRPASGRFGKKPRAKTGQYSAQRSQRQSR